MPMTPTADHAVNLFTLTMESRFGGNWSQDLDPAVIVGFAEEVAQGFGARRLEATGRSGPSVGWLFPDGSRVVTGSFGLRAEGAASPAEGLRFDPQQALAS